MKFKIVCMLIVIALLSSGCIDDIRSRFQSVPVVYINVDVTSQANKTVIDHIEAKGGEISKYNAPGVVLPDNFPAIFVEVLQVYNSSMPNSPLTTISAQNGQDFKGSGNYSFTVELIENQLNKSNPLYVYSEIITENRTRALRVEYLFNWTE